VNLFCFIVMKLYLDGCYIVMLFLNILLSRLVMCEYVIVWTSSGNDQLDSIIPTFCK
jgi:hypothetical protein